MATIRKVGSKWRVEIRKAGVNRSKYFDSKMKARAWADSVEARLHRGETLLDALERYAEEISPNKKGARWEQVRLAKLGRDPIAKKPIQLIDPPDLAKWRDERLKSVSGSSVRREMNLLSSVFQKAIREWGWCDHNPVREIDRPKESKERTRRITADEIERIQMALGFEGEVATKQHEVAVLFLLAIESAMRLGEMIGLDPKRIHLTKRYVELVDTKNGSSRNVPLSTAAVKLLQLVPDGFTVSSGVVSTLFRRACINAEIEGLRFHDTRREALSRLSKRMDVMNLAKISGHRDLRVLLNTYYSPDVQELVDLLD
jgi:integrase